MNKTRKTFSGLGTRLTVNSDTLAELLDCGRSTATKIGNDAEARIQVGKRVLWNTKRIQGYLDAISEGREV